MKLCISWAAAARTSRNSQAYESRSTHGRPLRLPDLVVIYLGMRVNTLTGIKTVLGFGPNINNSVSAKPARPAPARTDYLFRLSHAPGMRQYWRDFESLERWSRSEPHMLWWKQFLRDSGGTGFWHETYFMRGGMEAIYDDLPKPVGFSAFAPRSRRAAPCSRPARALKAGDRKPCPPMSEATCNGDVIRLPPATCRAVAHLVTPFPLFPAS